MIYSSNPIGVFDSGIGGLSVVKSIMQKLPHEDIIYFGDIARIPYGSKSDSTIKKFTEQTVRFLLKQEVKAIIIACNTISAVAKDTVLQLAGNIPVIDVISAGTKASCAISNKIGVIATPATINSNAYPRAIHQINPQAEVYTKACALFVPLVEEGFIEHPALELIAREYLQDMVDQQRIDSLVLGCTHYPLISKTIAKIMGDKVTIIDPAITACEELIAKLTQNNSLNPHPTEGVYKFYVTDIPVKFQAIGELFLNHPMEHLEVVSVE
ncbi:MAG TPA: glutamate racemase [Burkholderiales bacterium]|nr:glutamate racemase [Burkholderiales bacterium]